MANNSGWDFGAIWCGLMHQSVMWPIHGQYQCRICGRHYPALESDGKAEPHAHSKPENRPLFRPALPLLLLAIAAGAVYPAKAATNPQAADTLSRYLEEGGTVRWAAETLEIDAALPKLGKTGQLQAIRRMVWCGEALSGDAPCGEAKYLVLQLSGDSTVKEQVIVRYLKAEQRASEMPAISTAITPANYKFSYKGAGLYMDRAAFVFEITPRKKRQGLIKGELWLDADAAIPLRESGYLVKSPSLFIKRVEVTQDSVLQDGAVELRLTHLSVNTRLVGRAELVIEERPLVTAESGQATGDSQAGE